MANGGAIPPPGPLTVHPPAHTGRRGFALAGIEVGARGGGNRLSPGAAIRGAMEARMARVLNRLSHLNLSWIRIEIALLTGALILAG